MWLQFWILPLILLQPTVANRSREGSIQMSGEGSQTDVNDFCCTVDVGIGRCEAMVMWLVFVIGSFCRSIRVQLFLSVVLGSAMASCSSYTIMLLKVASDFDLAGWQLCWTQVGDGCCGLVSLLVVRQPRKLLYSRNHAVASLAVIVIMCGQYWLWQGNVVGRLFESCRLVVNYYMME